MLGYMLMEAGLNPADFAGKAMQARGASVTMLASVALALEYEATCRRTKHAIAAGLSEGEVAVFLGAVVGMVEAVESHFLWRPQLRDPGDELVLEAAVDGRAAAIVTFNLRDYGITPQRFGVDVINRGTALKRIRV